MSTTGRGGQVILTGAAQAAARGAYGPTMEANLAEMSLLERTGQVADGSTPDGTTLTGGAAYDPNGVDMTNLLVTQAGSTGTDYSANAATVPMPGFVLLATIPATASRAYAEVQNQSAGTIQLVRDDGAGANQTSVLIASGGSAGAQGGGWSSATFKGRVRVYGTTGAQVSAYQE